MSEIVPMQLSVFMCYLPWMARTVSYSSTYFIKTQYNVPMLNVCLILLKDFISSVQNVRQQITYCDVYEYIDVNVRLVVRILAIH